MKIACLDLEGVLVPEIWISFAEKTGVDGFRRTTRDEPDYDRLMRYRMDLLNRHSFGVNEIRAVIEEMEPFEGAREFLDELRGRTQVLILSDTFYEFATPLMEKLGRPTLLCNELEVDERGVITGYRLRCRQTKLSTVKALQSCGYETVAAGDSFNDLAMIRASSAGFLFRSTDRIKADNPDLPAFETFGELMKGFQDAFG
ncbi:MAG: bifunctional phosphoserine phosphatase/homoserine phosphotransferase ThrH [Kiritimatiellae bacterium]|nr:bifunctional phosphoserine phosphatase/homoserine phosphotransferase ThrH [Kiritimatiellia bacterium]